jgi:hypothetical protein
MYIQGSLERLLDSVVPHEVSHTIFATYFRRPLPRWADEGAATLVEHESERRRQQLLLDQIRSTNRRIPLKQLLAMKEYPRDMQNVLTLYAEGYSLADFLVEAGGRARFLSFLQHAHERGWDSAIKSHYELENVAALDSQWNDWIIAGSPRNDGDGTMLADANQKQQQKKERPNNGFVVRAQNPDVQPAAAGRPALREPVELPRTDKSSDPRREAVEDVAEDDNRTEPQEVLDDSSTAFAGDRQPRNQGWSPIGGEVDGRLPRPKPLEMRVEIGQAEDPSRRLR